MLLVIYRYLVSIVVAPGMILVSPRRIHSEFHATIINYFIIIIRCPLLIYLVLNLAILLFYSRRNGVLFALLFVAVLLHFSNY